LFAAGLGLWACHFPSEEPPEGWFSCIYPLTVYSPWFNPIEMLWRYFRREATHCELFQTVEKLIEASKNFFKQHNLMPEKVLSVIGSNALTQQNLFACTWCIVY